METLTALLEVALAGENACVHCGGAVPVTAAAIGFVSGLHADGDLDALDPEGLRMLLLLGSVDAGCGSSVPCGRDSARGDAPAAGCPGGAPAPAATPSAPKSGAGRRGSAGTAGSPATGLPGPPAGRPAFAFSS